MAAAHERQKSSSHCSHIRSTARLSHWPQMRTGRGANAAAATLGEGGLAMIGGTGMVAVDALALLPGVLTQLGAFCGNGTTARMACGFSNGGWSSITGACVCAGKAAVLAARRPEA